MSLKILTLMFHRIAAPALGCHPELFTRYLSYLVQHFPIVTPGDKLSAPLSICLTFDDAYYDFYHYVYPLLKQHKIKAILAVPTKYIIEDCTLASKQRLNLPSYEFMEAQYQNNVPLCTWKELHEMQQSGFVLIANHSYSHTNLVNKTTDLKQEILYSKEILTQKLNMPVHYFVYPYGKMDHEVHQLVCQHYQFGIRIGGAINQGWDYKHQLIYRLTADPLWIQGQPITSMLIKKLTLRYWLNRIRGK